MRGPHRPSASCKDRPSGEAGPGARGGVSARGRGPRKPGLEMWSKAGSCWGPLGGLPAGFSISKPTSLRLGGAGRGESDSEAGAEEESGDGGKDQRRQGRAQAGQTWALRSHPAQLFPGTCREQLGCSAGTGELAASSHPPSSASLHPCRQPSLLPPVSSLLLFAKQALSHTG